MTATLDELLATASAASPTERIEYRDPIATHGVNAIAAISPWLGDPQLGAFAVRVIQAVGRQGHRAAAFGALESGLGTVANEAVRGDIAAGIAEFAPPGKRRVVAGQLGYEVLAEDLTLRGQPAVQYRIETHKERGHFNVPRAIMDLLAIPTDGFVDLDVRRSATGGIVFSGRMGIASGTEIYPTADEASTTELGGLKPYESIDVTVALAK